MDSGLKEFQPAKTLYPILRGGEGETAYLPVDWANPGVEPRSDRRGSLDGRAQNSRAAQLPRVQRSSRRKSRAERAAYRRPGALIHALPQALQMRPRRRPGQSFQDSRGA